MSAVVLVAIGLAWFYFWIRGGIFAAVIAAIAGLLWIGVIADFLPSTPFLIGLIVGPWVPIVLRISYQESRAAKARA